MKVASSERLSFRLMNENDAPLLFELDQDPAVMKYINGGKPNSMDDILNTFIPRLNAFTNQEKGWGLWQVNITQTNEFIGWVLVRPMGFFGDDRNDTDLELGWRFKQASWGKGYASEAAKQVVNMLEQDKSIKALSATALPDNQGSINIMKKLGMAYIKTYMHQDPLGECEAVLYRKNLN